MKNKVLPCLLCLLLCLQFAACANMREGIKNNNPSGEIETPADTGTGDDETATTDPTASDTPTATTPTTPTTPNTPTTPDSKPTEKKKDTLLKCTASSLNVRSGPGTSYSKEGLLANGDMVMPLDLVNGWYKIAFKNGEAYISASYVEKVEFDTASDAIERVIYEGKKLLGTPYDYGAQRYHWGPPNATPNTNFTGETFDCSSLMQYIFKIGADYNLDVNTKTQCVQGTEIAKDNIRRGDLLFFTNSSHVNNTGIDRIGHVALYLGDNMILHTASDYAVIEAISAGRWNYFIMARRVID